MNARNCAKGLAGHYLAWTAAILVACCALAAMNSRVLASQHLGIGPLVLAADEPDKSIVAGRKALESSHDYPWYDAKTDDVRALPMAPDREPRGADWIPDAPASGLSLLQVVAWLAIGLILAVLLFFLIKAYLDREDSTALPPVPHLSPSMNVDKVEALPFQLQRGQTDWLAEARRLYDEGKFSEAIVYLFSFELLQLDRHGVIRLAKGKTNRQYVREASRERRPLALLLEQTMVAFELAFFGHHDLPREQFESCWQRVSEFERLAAEGT